MGGLAQEILTWYDESGKRHLSGEEQALLQAERERLRAVDAEVRVEQERSRRKQLEDLLRSQGFDPDNLPGI